MTTEGAENNYHSSSASSKMPEKISLADITPGGAADNSDSNLAADTDAGSTSTDDMLRQGIYSQPDNANSVRSDATDLNVARTGTPSKFDRLFLDQTQLATVMKEFGELTLTEGPQGGMSEGSVSTALKAHEASFEFAVVDGAGGGNDDVSDAPADRDTQEAFARLAVVTPGDSEIMDRMHQTWDRLSAKDNLLSA